MRIEKGKRYIYREDGWKAEVEVLEDLSDEEYERYRLKVIRSFRQSDFGFVSSGEEFRVEHIRDPKYARYKVWTLRES